MKSTIKLIGGPQSPYSRKMMASLRYRRIPFQWVRMGSPEAQAAPKQKIPGMVPVLWFSHEDSSKDTASLDSTFQLKHLETVFSERSLYPVDPVVNFFNVLLEDFGDEWMTKCMFHFRWHYEADADKAGTVLPLQFKWNQPDANIQLFKEQFSKRQIERLWVVGSNPTTKEIIENSYVDTLKAMDSILSRQAFLLGERASVADFGIMGQLVCLAHFEKTSADITLEVAPRIYAWVEAIEDLSGETIEDQPWSSRDSIGETLSPLLNVIGKYYVPFLLANAEALNSGAEKVQCEIAGKQWEQKPFPYQGKCLMWLREEFAKLSPEDQSFALKILNENNCQNLI